MYGAGAIQLPQEVCFSAIRILVIWGQNNGVLSDKLSYHKGKAIFVHYDGVSTEEELGTCGTETVKQPFDKFSPDVVKKILNTFEKVSFDDGMTELEEFLNRNIQLTCLTS